MKLNFILLALISTLLTQRAWAISDYPVIKTFKFQCKVPGISQLQFDLDLVRTEWHNTEIYNDGWGRVENFSYPSDSSVVGTLIDSGRDTNIIKFDVSKKIYSDDQYYTAFAKLRIAFSALSPLTVAKVEASVGNNAWAAEFDRKVPKVTGSCQVESAPPSRPSRPPYGLPSL